MLLTLYTTEKILTEIIESEETFDDAKQKFRPWYILIKKLKPKLKFFLDENSDYDESEDNIIFSFIHENDLDGDDRKDNKYLEDIKEMKAGLEMSSSALFILDVTAEKARKISSNYGVVCHSFDETPETCPIFQEGIELFCERKEENRSWKELLLPECVFPSNSLIFVDRYLFSDDTGDITYQDGLDNVSEILNNVLPPTLGPGASYSILFVFDKISRKRNEDKHNCNKNNLSDSNEAFEGQNLESTDDFKWISSRINNVKKELKKSRNYEIIIEALAVDRNCGNYIDTHNRRIISNYFIINAANSLKAFRKSESLYTQKISLDWAASKGIIRAFKSNFIEKDMRNSLNGIRKIVDSQKKSVDIKRYSQNGNCAKRIEDISNPLLKD